MKKQREVYQGGQLLLPELRMLGTDAPRAAVAGLGSHRHASAFEICYIARGMVSWWVRDELDDVGPGEVYITRPDEPHGGVDAALHPCELYWLVLPMPAGRALPGLGAAATRRLREGLLDMTLRHFPASAALPGCFERLLTEHRAPGGELAVPAARAALHELLVTVLRDHARALAGGMGEPNVSAAIGRAMQWMQRHLAEPFSIDEAAAVARLSVTQFHERFHGEVGFTPGEWRTRQRLRDAKRLLRQSDRAITAIAMDTGFASSQYFATVFKRMVGLTPRQYRRRSAEAADATV